MYYVIVLCYFEHRLESYAVRKMCRDTQKGKVVWWQCVGVVCGGSVWLCVVAVCGCVWRLLLLSSEQVVFRVLFLWFQFAVMWLVFLFIMAFCGFDAF